MKTIVTVISILIAVTLIVSAGAAAQKSAGQTPTGQAGQQDQPAGHGMMGGGIMGQGMSGMMMCPMMGRGMGMGMGGMMGGGQMEPKAMGQMLQLRGEILKAVGDVLIKHGKAVGETK